MRNKNSFERQFERLETYALMAVTYLVIRWLIVNLFEGLFDSENIVRRFLYRSAVVLVTEVALWCVVVDEFKHGRAGNGLWCGGAALVIVVGVVLKLRRDRLQEAQARQEAIDNPREELPLCPHQKAHS